MFQTLFLNHLLNSLDVNFMQVTSGRVGAEGRRAASATLSIQTLAWAFQHLVHGGQETWGWRGAFSVTSNQLWEPRSHVRSGSTGPSQGLAPLAGPFTQCLEFSRSLKWAGQRGLSLISLWILSWENKISPLTSQAKFLPTHTC